MFMKILLKIVHLIFLFVCTIPASNVNQARDLWLVFTIILTLGYFLYYSRIIIVCLQVMISGAIKTYKGEKVSSHENKIKISKYDKKFDNDILNWIDEALALSTTFLSFTLILTTYETAPIACFVFIIYIVSYYLQYILSKSI